MLDHEGLYRRRAHQSAIHGRRMITTPPSSAFTLRQVLRRPILADELAVVIRHQETDEQRCTIADSAIAMIDTAIDQSQVIPFSRRTTCHE